MMVDIIRIICTRDNRGFRGDIDYAMLKGCGSAKASQRSVSKKSISWMEKYSKQKEKQMQRHRSINMHAVFEKL